MRLIPSILLCFPLALLFTQCESIDDIDYQEVAINDIPETSRELGLEVANNINNAIRYFHKNGIDYSDANETNFRNRFYTDFARIYPEIMDGTSAQSLKDIRITPEEFAKGVNNLTTIQISFINRIIDECSKSGSYTELYKTIRVINHDIRISVPEIQQERLFNITSVLFYGFHEIQELEANGFIIQTPTKKFSKNLIKSRSEGGDMAISSACRKILATVWTIAVGEPTPAGEIVASIVSVVIAGIYLYEVWLCAKDENSESNYNTERYCQDRFANCSSPIPDGCGTCLRFCLVQGYWPPYETHQCS